MIWPFKRKPRMTVAEFAATFPPAPCGRQEMHYEWTQLQGMRCPACSAIKAKEREEASMDALADKIAARLR